MLCRTASVFLYDKVNDDLFSGAILGVENVLRVRKDRGVVGYSFTKNEMVNIRNAYEDERFENKYDIENGFKTDTILCVPIRNSRDEVMGVL